MSTKLANLALARGRIAAEAGLRRNAEALRRLRAAGSTRFLHVRAGEVRVESQSPLLPVDPGGELAYLGTADDVSYFSTICSESDTGDFQSLRAIGAVVSDLEAGLAVTAVALDQWHRTHQHCPRCGAATEPAEGGWIRRCPADGTEHFPRTDPAVIVAIFDAEDRLLLARQRIWQEGFYSVVAGFVEPGESSEAAVAREVLEEVGLVVHDVNYLASQPWPFPASLMLAFEARAEGDPVVDGEEIAEAAWFSRDELRAACESGKVRLPSAVSIAHRMIEQWLGHPLPSDWLRS